MYDYLNDLNFLFSLFFRSHCLNLHTDAKLALTVTDWMWFPWLQPLGQGAMVCRKMSLWFVAVSLDVRPTECDSGVSSDSAG